VIAFGVPACKTKICKLQFSLGNAPENRSGYLLHPARANAASANADSAHNAIDDRLDPLQVGLPHALGFVVRVTDVMTD
jgi:hypothetical protein